MLEKTLKSPLDCKEIQPARPKGNQSWMFTGWTDAKAGPPIFGHLMQRAYSLEETLMLKKIKGKRWMDGRGWDGWMSSLTQWTRVWANSGEQWRTGEPGTLLVIIHHNLPPHSSLWKHSAYPSPSSNSRLASSWILVAESVKGLPGETDYLPC